MLVCVLVRQVAVHAVIEELQRMRAPAVPLMFYAAAMAEAA